MDFAISIVSGQVSLLSGAFFFALQATLMVFRDIENPYTVASGQGHARSRLPWAVSVAHFDRYFFLICTAMMSLRDVV